MSEEDRESTIYNRDLSELEKELELLSREKEKDKTFPKEIREEGKTSKKDFGITRISTGVAELDKALHGGIPKGSWVAITGEPGTGKSILCMHFAWAGLISGDPVVYVTTEAEFRDVVRQARQFNIDFESYRIHDISSSKEISEVPQIVVIDIFGLLKIARQMSEYTQADSEGVRKRRFAALDIQTLVSAIHEAYKVLGVLREGGRSPYKHVRLIVDSLSAFWADKPAMARKYSYDLKISTHRENVTAYLVSQYAMTTKSVDYKTPIVIKYNDTIEICQIGRFVDRFFNYDEEGIKLIKIPIYTLSVNPKTLKVEWRILKAVARHRENRNLLRIELEGGRSVSVTQDHSIYILNRDRIKPIKGSKVREGDSIPVLLQEKIENLNNDLKTDFIMVKRIEEEGPSTPYVYDLSVDMNENFIAGIGWILVHNSTFGFGLEHIADGVFHLWMEDVEESKEVKRYMIIKKMRMTDHIRTAFRVEIEPNRGFVLYPLSS
ncbi:MAG: ATPase domain-containing protein [Ignisphaera sp.]